MARCEPNWAQPLLLQWFPGQCTRGSGAIFCVSSLNEIARWYHCEPFNDEPQNIASLLRARKRYPDPENALVSPAASLSPPRPRLEASRWRVADGRTIYYVTSINKIMLFYKTPLLLL